MTCVVHACEGKDIVMVDILSTFLQIRMPKDEKMVHVVLDGRMAQLLAKISPKTYQKYIHHKQRQAYINCQQDVAL